MGWKAGGSVGHAQQGWQGREGLSQRLAVAGAAGAGFPVQRWPKASDGRA